MDKKSFEFEAHELFLRGVTIESPSMDRVLSLLGKLDPEDQYVLYQKLLSDRVTIMTLDEEIRLRS